MSYKASAWAVEQRVGDPTAKLLLLTLAESAGIDEPECWPKRKTLAERIEASDDTLDRKLKLLVELGLLTIRIRKGPDGGNLPNIYRLNLDRESGLKNADLRGPSPQIAGTLPASSCGDPSPQSCAAQKGHSETSLKDSCETPGAGASPSIPKGGLHREFFDLWAAAYLERFGDRFAFSAADAATVKRLLRQTEKSAAELVAIAGQAWEAHSVNPRWHFACGQAGTIRGFASAFNRIIVELRSGRPGATPRLGVPTEQATSCVAEGLA